MNSDVKYNIPLFDLSNSIVRAKTRNLLQNMQFMYRL